MTRGECRASVESKALRAIRMNDTVQGRGMYYPPGDENTCINRTYRTYVLLDHDRYVIYAMVMQRMHSHMKGDM